MKRIALAAASLAGLSLLAGCALQTTATDLTQFQPAVAGRAMGGSIPIVGAIITLYAAGTTGYGSAPTVIGTSSPTDANGFFNITRTGTCTDPQQLYIVTSGGTQSGVANPKIVLFEALGTCSTVTSSTVVVINEATTVAAAYALSGFANVDGSSINVGATNTNALGLQHAFANAQNLVTISGQARAITLSNNGLVPYAVINSLADSLVACVDSNGSTGACNNIAVPPPSGMTTGTPTNAWQIALNWALYPNYNVSAVYNNQTPPYFFLPNLSSFPSDLSIAIAYNAGTSTDGAAATAPTDVKADASGNIWLSGMSGAPLAELGADGSVLSPAGGLGSGALKSGVLNALAIDPRTSNVWAADGNGNLFSYSPAFGTTTAYPLPSSITYNAGTSTASTQAQSLAIDFAGDVWYGTGTPTPGAINILGELAFNGSTYSPVTSWPGNPFMPSNSIGSAYMAFAPSNNSPASRVLLSSDLSAPDYDYFLYPYNGNVTRTMTIGGISQGVTFDPAGNAWVIASGSGANGGSLCQLTPYNTVTCHSVPTVAGQNGLYSPSGIAGDGAGRYFVASNNGQASIVEYDTNAGFLTNTAGNGFSPVDSSKSPVLAAGALRNLTIDSTGSIWVANSTSAGRPVIQILGPAAPTLAPVSPTSYNARP